MKTMIGKIFLVLLLSAPTLLYAQVAGDVANVKFEEVKTPVPGQSVSAGDAGGFYHALYSGSAWGDYDNDGYLDLFYSDRNEHVSSSAIQSNFYKNKGDGTFSRLRSPFKGLAFSCPVWFDMNNDGLLDLLLPGLNNYNYAWADENTRFDQIETLLYISEGIADDGTVSYREISAAEAGIRPIYNGKTGGKGHNWVATGDYDNDGYIDIVMTGFDDNMRPETDHPEDAVRAVYLYKNIGGESFRLQQNPLNGTLPFHGETDGSVCLSDLDGDGWLDLVSSGYGLSRNSELHVYWNNGDGTFSEGDQALSGLNDSSFGICDFNNDGFADIVATGIYFNTKAKNFYIWKNLGKRRFEKVETDMEHIDGGQLSFGDINHDGLPDILVGGHGETHEHTTWIYVNQGDFTFASWGAYYDDPLNKKGHFGRITHGSHHLIDYDNDGFLDAWFSGWVNGSCSKGCDVMLYRNTSATKNTLPNEAPAAPAQLAATFDSATGEALFTWSAPLDDVTPAEALRYNLYLRKKDAGECFMTLPADINTGFIRTGSLSGAIVRCSYRMKINTNGEYQWGVQAIDNGNRGSLFAGALLTVSGVIDDVKTAAPEAIGIWAEGHRICYTLEGSGRLSLIALNGALVFQQQVAGAGALFRPETGIYIVEIATAFGVKRQMVHIR